MKKSFSLFGLALLCLPNGVKATELVLKQDNTAVVNHAQQTAAYKTNRPAVKDRLYVSPAVEAEIKRVKQMLTNPKLAWMFENCFPNTLDTTVHYRERNGKPDTFVYTGDIHAMWLRDSGAQVWPYVQLANQGPELKKMLEGVIRRQFLCINIDPYANGYNDGPTGGEWMTDGTDMKPELHERKWEIDSLCYPLRLAYQYWKVTGDASVFDADWIQAITNILKTFKEQQRKVAWLFQTQLRNKHHGRLPKSFRPSTSKGRKKNIPTNDKSSPPMVPAAKGNQKASRSVPTIKGMKPKMVETDVRKMGTTLAFQALV